MTPLPRSYMADDMLVALAVVTALLAVCVSILVFLLVATRVTVRYRLREAGTIGAPGFFEALEGLTNSPSRTVDSALLFDDPPTAYDAMLADIVAATSSITFETYLFWSGRVADRFVAALTERARAGVTVRILFDADGSRFLWRYDVKALRDAGCELRFFRPFRWFQPVQYNHRTHRKLLIVDGRVGWTGGLGIADMWLGPPPWLETMVRMEGDVLTLLQGAFFQNWVIAGGALDLGPAMFPPPRSGAALPRAMVTCSAPIWGDSTMRLLYFTAIASATRRLYLASPYFLPNWDTMAMLAAAAARGVDVRLLLPGSVNDKNLPYWASRRHYGPLLAAGVRIFEYRPAMMHAKAMVIDDHWCTLGSTNFDPRSFFLNSELNVSIEDPAFAATVDAFFARGFAHSVEQSYEGWKRRGLLERIGGAAGLLIKDQL